MVKSLYPRLFLGMGRAAGLEKLRPTMALFSSAASEGLAATIHKQTKLVTWGGAMVLTSAFILACINIVMVIINSTWERKIPMILEIEYMNGGEKVEATFGRVRQQLGEITALGLEILVVADILESLTKDVSDFSWNSLGKMAVMAVFRTSLAMALAKEVSEIKEENLQMEQRKSKKTYSLAGSKKR